VRLEPGVRLGPYEIMALDGAGGMGEVYRARDTRLGRVVAIKVIGLGFGEDAEMRRRFDEEGRLAAQLDHPRICAVHDVGHDTGVDYLVMEYLEGRTLADRLKAGPLPFGELLGYAIEIAAGLAYAHRRGVIHRDLKPGNIVLTRSGVKIVDFGLATVRQAVSHHTSTDVAGMNTVPLTPPVANAIIGTAQYLPPERIYGHEIDHRGDIFGFGAVLYEMATGRRAFDGSTPATLIAAILTSEPPRIPDTTPSATIDWIVRECLKKDPTERWESMRDVESVLKRIASAYSSGLDQPHDRPRRTIMRSAQLAALLVVAAIAGIALIAVESRSARVDHSSPIAVVVPPPSGAGFTPTESSKQSSQLAISPDGQTLAFVASTEDGVPQIWIRRLDSPVPHAIAGTDRASYPFWSASSHSLGFFAGRQLKRVDLDGGPPRALASAPNGRGGTWSLDDVILYAPQTDGTIFRVSAAGGPSQPATAVRANEVSHRWPQFLPDGRHFLYFARSADEKQCILLGSLDGQTVTEVTDSPVGGVFMPPDQLLYVSDGVLLAASFDPAAGRLRGDPVPVVDRIATSSNFYGAFSASTNGVLAYATSASFAELVWVGRDGRRLGVAAPRGSFVDFRLSPDGRYVAVADVDAHQ